MFNCGCGNAHQDPMQVVAYSSVQEGEVKKEMEKRRSMSTPEQRTIYLPFSEFQHLMTRKLLKQLREVADDAVVEGTSHSVSCFLWTPVQDWKKDGAQYKIQEFRASDFLQKQQSKARALVPVTEADELDDSVRASVVSNKTGSFTVNNQPVELNAY